MLSYHISITRQPKVQKQLISLHLFTNNFRTLQRGHNNLTIFDTRLRRWRTEQNNGYGKMRNLQEVELVLFVVHDLINLVHVDAFHGLICVLDPYLDHVQAFQEAI